MLADSFKELLNPRKNKEENEKSKINEELCVVISSTNKFEFQELLNNNLNRGFEIIASSCNTKEYRAILCDKRLKCKNIK